jgi:4-aminobutyrate--pyruvate transaminase
MQREFGLPLPGFLHTLCPDAYRGLLEGETEDAFTDRLVAELERMIVAEGANTISAFIAEPINAGGGIVVPPAGYFEKVQEVLRRHDILMLDDEIVCGFGRTGNWFGCQTVGMKPDMMALAKGISSSYFPISAVMMSEAIHEGLAEFNQSGEIFGHGFTNSGHPVGVAVSLEALRIYHEMDVVSHVRKMGQRLRDGLRAASVGSKIVGQIRGEGLMIGVELVADPATRTPFAPAQRVGSMFDELALANGLIIRPMGDIIGFSPPLIVGEHEVDEMAALFGKTLAEVECRLAASRSAAD